MSDTADHIDLDQAEKILKIVNLRIDSQLKEAQKSLLPWQFLLSALTLAFTAGAGLSAGVFALVRWVTGS